MKTLLRIDSSIRTKVSWSKHLADYFTEQWKNAHPLGKVMYRDLAKQPIPHIEEATIAGFYTSDQNRTQETAKAIALSDELIAELKSANEVLISSPMYNYNIPSTLKAYIDHIFRINQTFEFKGDQCQGLLANKKTYVITVKGGILKGTTMEGYDFQDPYLKAVLELMGLKVERVFSLEGTSNQETGLRNQNELKKTIQSVFINQKTADLSTHTFHTLS